LKLIPKVDLIYEYKNPKYGPGPSTSMGPNIRKFVFPGFFIGFFLFLAFLKAPDMRNNRFQWSISCLLTKSSTVSKSKHFVLGTNLSWRYGTMPKSLWAHFL
jgi:hypothetical protein